MLAEVAKQKQSNRVHSTRPMLVEVAKYKKMYSATWKKTCFDILYKLFCLHLVPSAMLANTLPIFLFSLNNTICVEEFTAVLRRF